MSVHDLPAVNATLNAISGILLLIGYTQIKAGRRDQHLARLHPELDEVGVKLLWVELHYGPELADRLRAHLATPR